MRATAVALIALLLTASCGGEAAPGDAATATEQTTQEPAAPGLIEPSAEQPSEASSKFAPNVGDTALVIGETRRGMDYTTKLATYRYPYPPKLYREPKRRYEYFGIKLRQCMRPSATATEEAYSHTRPSQAPGGRQQRTTRALPTLQPRSADPDRRVTQPGEPRRPRY
jgi:hypothetical protein